MMTSLLCLALFIALSTVPAMAQTTPKTPLLALASSFRALWPDLMVAYQRDTGLDEPRTSFASSGLLTTQIRHGAPFELYISADQTTVNMLQKLNKTRDAGVTLAYGTLALIRLSTRPTANISNSNPPLSLAGLKELQKTAKHFTLAIANPRHAPYGVAAKQALDSAGLWPLPPSTLLNAENAAQTLQFVQTGAVDFAIVPLTLVTHSVTKLQITPLIPDGYTPVAHQMVLLNSATAATEHIFEWMQRDSAAKVLTRFGLTLAP